MLMKHDPTTSTTPPPIPTVCGNCGLFERRLLHNVRHRGIFRRLCTSCVLRLHPHSFCPTCFVVHEPPRSPNDAVVSCFKCYSSSHSHCVGPTPANPYICPPCTNPSVPIFSLKKGEGEENEKFRVINKNAAKILLAAAKIAAASMNKAAVAARVEAERRAKEAAFTRKRAREAVEHVLFLVAKEKLKRKELLASAEVSGSGGNVALEGKIHSNKIGNVNNSVEQNLIGNQNEVLAALNAVELREKGESQGLRAHNMILGPSNNGVAMNVEDNEKIKVSLGPNMVAMNFQKGNENKRSGDSGNLDNHNAVVEKVNNGVDLIPPIGDKLQHVQNSHGREENVGSQQ